MALRWALDPTATLTHADWPIARDADTPGESDSVVVTFSLDAGGRAESAIRTIRRIGPRTGRAHYQLKSRTPVEEKLKKANVPKIREELTLVPYGEKYTEPGKIDRTKILALRDEYLREHNASIVWTDEWEDLDSAPEGLPVVLLIPAVLDLADFTGERSKSAFRQIIAHRLKHHLMSQQEVQDAVSTLQTAFAKLNATAVSEDGNPLTVIQNELAGALSDWQVRFKIDVGALSPPDLSSFIEPATSVFVDDGAMTSANSKGHGLQRAMLLELIRFEARMSSVRGAEKQPPMVLLVEEPEIYLHPQKQRSQARKLREIANSPSHQVLLTTHSPYFVDLANPRGIVRVSKPASLETRTQQISADLFTGDHADSNKRAFNMAYWFSQGRAEMLFARRIAFVEGPTEMALFPLLAEKLGVFDESVTLIDCASKDNLPLYCEVADLFGLDYVVVHDEDPVPPALQALADADFADSCCSTQRDRKKAEHRSKSRSTATNAAIFAAAKGRRVVVFSPDIEAEAGISRAQGSKKSKQMAAVERFQDVSATDIPESIREVVRAIYGISEAAVEVGG